MWPPTALSLRDLDLIAIYDAPNVATARARWDVARAAIQTANALPNPTLSLNPAYVTDGGAAPPYFLAGTLIQLIETAGKRPLRVAKAGYAAESARLQAVSAVWTTIARVDGAAIDMAAARARAAALDEQASVQAQVVETATKRLALGLGSSVELTVARTALTRATLDRQAALAAEVDASHRLAEAVGLSQSALPVDRLVLGLDASALPDRFLNSARDATPLRRADVLSGVADYAASVIDTRLQRAARTPNLEVGPSIEYDQGTRKWGASISGALPIFNRNGGPIAEADAQQRVAGDQLLETQTAAIGEVDRAVGAYQQAVRGLAAADRLVDEQSRQLAAQNSLLRAGQAGRADVLAVQGDLALARLGRADALATLARARLAIEIAAQATSDGFDPAARLTELDGK